MQKRFTNLRYALSILAFPLLLLGAVPTEAGNPPPRGMCALDVVPAATLLVPYFEVDLDSPDGRTTQVYFHNASPDPTLVHVTFWTDWGLPTIDFDVFLTGYDAEILDLADVFYNGNLPITSDAQSDPADSISPHGDHPEWDGSFQECENFFPFFVNPLIVGSNYERLVDGHTGQPISNLEDRCLGQSHGDNVARGFVTIDVVNRCSVDFPSDPSYWDVANPVLSMENRIFGDIYFIDPGEGTMSSMPAVHLQADPSFDAGSTPSGATFYGRFATGGLDRREPLPSIWGIGLEPETGLVGDSELLVWRDPTVAQTSAAACGSGPDWKGLSTLQVSCFDHQESILETCLLGEPCFPLGTQRIDPAVLVGPPAAGGNWCYFDLGVDDSGVSDDVDFPSAGGTYAQAWVGRIDSSGSSITRAGHQGVVLSPACEASTGLTPPVLHYFVDGFESGDLSRWSSAVQ